MPYKSEKIKIANTQYDRRIKLSEDDKEQIQDRYFNRGESMRSLSRVFKVDRQVIKYTLFPDYKKQFYKANRERVKPEIENAKHNAYMRTHRAHKQSLYVSGKISLKKDDS
jgi:transposase-like protein